MLFVVKTYVRGRVRKKIYTRCENALRTLFDLSRLVTAGGERKKNAFFTNSSSLN